MLRRTKKALGAAYNPAPASVYDQTVLVLQGGGALGAYQAGAFEVLDSEGVHPDWVAGISIGAVNAALIAGNAPEDRLRALKAFWNEVSADPTNPFLSGFNPFWDMGLQAISGMKSVMGGVPGMFRPWGLPPWLQPSGTEGAVSFYDTSPLRRTLLNHVDFDRINRGGMRLSLGAVNVRTGNFVYFDTHEGPGARKVVIGPEHVLASGALPPGFGAVEIDGEFYWDGAMVSNTPLSYVLEAGTELNRLVFQIDLFSASGPVPRTLDEVQERMKDIGYSSRTRLGTDAFRDKYRLRRTLSGLIDALPEKDRAAAIARIGAEHLHEGRVSIVHLINRGNRDEFQSKDYDFSRPAMLSHWEDGGRDAHQAVAQQSWRQLPEGQDGLAIYDYAKSDQAYDFRR